MNILDLMIIAVIGISAIAAYYRGFLYTIFKTLSTIVSIYLSYIGYKPINSMLRKTFLYEWLQKIAISNVSGLQGAMGLSEQTQLINTLNLSIPSGIQENLIHHNNPEIYNLLGANDFKAYVGGYIANFYLSIIAFMLLFFVIKAAIYLLSGGVKFVARLPIISFFDKWLGLGVGMIKGIISIWIGTIILTLLIVMPQFNHLSIILSQSTLAQWFYENNLILDIIDQVFL